MSALSEERLIPVDGVEIAYQEVGDPAGEPLLLIMGLGMQMIAWEDEFCGLLAERGFRVVRFDNRDVGNSTKFEAAGFPRRVDMLLARRRTAPYLLSDMARDTLGLMDALEIESAHLAGVSMGGMIAQVLAIEAPQRVRSLVSIMSTTGNRWLGLPTRKAFRTLFLRPRTDRAEAIEQAVHIFRMIGSPGYPLEEDRVRELAGAFFDRDPDRSGVARQLHAITASGDRTAALRGLRLPATVLHGASDPLIRPRAGRATAGAIPGARLRLLEGMGHDFPPELWPEFVEEIATTAARAGAGVGTDGPEGTEIPAGETQRFGPTNPSRSATSALRET